MRGSDGQTSHMFSYVVPEQRVRADHPLRVIRGIVNAALSEMSAEFDMLYPPTGRDSIPPERLLRALLLQAFYSIRSERQLVERIDFDLLFRWFVGLGVDDPVWDATTFTKHRDRLLAGEVAGRFLASVLAQPKVRTLLSTEPSLDRNMKGISRQAVCSWIFSTSSKPFIPGRRVSDKMRSGLARSSMPSASSAFGQAATL